MIIKSLKLKDYRNYNELSLDLDKGINIFIGDNAQGKTNILESIYMAGTTRSHRGSRDRDIIGFDREEAHIEMIVNRSDADYMIDMHLKRNSNKGVAVNKIPVRRAGELLGIVNLVFFAPEDLSIIKSSPDKRRKFMDMELCQLDKVYLHDLANYNKIVNQRNKLLKDPNIEKEYLDMLDIWDLQLIDYGSRIISRRADFIRELNMITEGLHSTLTGGREELKIIYEPDTGINDLSDSISRYRDRDLKLRTTTVGPHRDDIMFMTNGIDVRRFGSQGQQRTAALSLKLSEIRLVESITGDKPILLLDDVLSELDKNRQEYLLDNINDIQTLITCTGLDEFIDLRFQINKIFRVSGGRVSVEN